MQGKTEAVRSGRGRCSPLRRLADGLGRQARLMPRHRSGFTALERAVGRCVLVTTDHPAPAIEARHTGNATEKTALPQTAARLFLACFSGKGFFVFACLRPVCA